MSWDWNDSESLTPPWSEPPARIEAILPDDIGILFPDATKLKLFEAGTRVPAKVLKVFTTTQDNQTNLSFNLVQYSEESRRPPTRELGRFLVSGIQDASKGEPHIELLMIIDELGNLKIRARDRRLNVPMELKILYGKEDKTFAIEGESDVQLTFEEIIIARVALRQG